MLQQTTVATVTRYFAAFMARWPRVEDLAAASLDEVLHAWQGLGYYARARRLHACAQAVAQRHGGRFPDTEEGLRALPGIGAYTAAAIAAIAFGRPAAVMDGNVERVMARLYAVDQPLPASKPILYRHAAALTPALRAGDYAQGVMDLGATICTPRKPRCVLCPWIAACRACRQGDAEGYPALIPRPARPARHGAIFWLTRPDGAVLMRRRPEEGLLGGLMEFPSTPWRDAPWPDAEAMRAAPVADLAPRRLAGAVNHVFTHFRLELIVFAARVPARSAPADGIWVQPRDFGDHALPTLMKKVARHALSGLADAPVPVVRSGYGRLEDQA
jgi:A/G-specific adenine glycosylase